MKIKILITVMITSVVAVTLGGCGRTTVDLNNYVSLECDGADSQGVAKLKIDYDNMVSDNLSAFGLSQSSSANDITTVVSEMEQYINGNIDKSTELSNGDDIRLTWSVDDGKIEQLYPIDLEYNDTDFDVAGLKKLAKFDPFANVNVFFSG